MDFLRKYRCLKPELFKDIAPGEVVRCFFDGKGRISYIVLLMEESLISHAGPPAKVLRL